MNIDFAKLEEKLKEVFTKACQDKLNELKESVEDNGFGYGFCGGAYIVFKDKRNSFCKQLRAYNRALKSFDDYSLDYGTCGRQEAEVKEAGVRKVVDYLNANFDCNARVRTYID